AEKDHIEDFAPEVAWVTKSGDGDLNEPIAIRPTSETIMYPAFRSWIHSHRDLPIKLNQWCNEGHTAHATKEEADVEVLQILEFYAAVYEELLAVPVIKGRKTEKEKFAGGDYTTTVEAFIPAAGRAIQGATSHGLGQNFGKMFRIEFEGADGKKAIPWQNSWGLTTRTLGVMVHGDDKGLVLPPRVAPLQAVIVPITMKDVDEGAQLKTCGEIAAALREAGVRVHGVPLRLELGPKDMAKQQIRVVRRDTNDKEDVPLSILPQKAALLLVQMRAARTPPPGRLTRDSYVAQALTWEDFMAKIGAGNLEFEELVKKRSKEEALAAAGEEAEDDRAAISLAVKTLCIPYEAPPLPDGTPCFISGKPAVCWTLWGRSY
ncbi:hypothetical protein EMIHUDRAFT_244659, partial [Emiliania huxleyi CCMP1516]